MAPSLESLQTVLLILTKFYSSIKEKELKKGMTPIYSSKEKIDVRKR